MPLLDLPNHMHHLASRLAAARLRDRIAHAYLFTGDHLETLIQLATAWAQATTCTQLTPAGDACGACLTCCQLADLSYAHLYRLRPQSKSRNILIDEIREFEHQLYLKTGGQRKIGMIIEADRMNENAQNAFLKTLEEPSPGTILMLITISPAGLLPTIISRCQLVSLQENRIVYDTPELAPLIAALAPMQRGVGARVAIHSANAIGTILGTLQKRAEEITADQITALKANYKELEPAQRKRLDAQADAIIAAQYLTLRDTFFSALHSWFAHEYLRANDVPHDQLPNPELYQTLADQLPMVPSIADARRAMTLTDDFLQSLRFNVDAALALQDYCQKICAKV